VQNYNLFSNSTSFLNLFLENKFPGFIHILAILLMNVCAVAGAKVPPLSAFTNIFNPFF
jgi:hypothetical protein